MSRVAPITDRSVVSISLVAVFLSLAFWLAGVSHKVDSAQASVVQERVERKDDLNLLRSDVFRLEKKIDQILINQTKEK